MSPIAIDSQKHYSLHIKLAFAPFIGAEANLKLRKYRDDRSVIAIAARRLERIMKEVLDDFSEDKVKLEQLISGRRVQLAEDLSMYSSLLQFLCYNVMH